MAETIGFFQEVEICNADHEHYGKRGVILGISEEGDRLFGYVVLIHDMNTTTYFEPADLAVTGTEFPREQFY
ncbi:hypothetical protein PPL19_23671 [Pseudomonas psychrotolerans L19]|uniref:Imm31 family immunity protein n=1 Tax=Pseudomonas oryzihabitans TaxID=47885 RepID=UPI00023A3EA7|nr:Imm31 family immunity protein [Pseudomonas psychrotolerans]EHK68554.1 hypothetical protein PPL19_23671 [Pseudomonas psychrotolerans L19]